MTSDVQLIVAAVVIVVGGIFLGFVAEIAARRREIIGLKEQNEYERMIHDKRIRELKHQMQTIDMSLSLSKMNTNLLLDNIATDNDQRFGLYEDGPHVELFDIDPARVSDEFDRIASEIGIGPLQQ